MAERKPAKCLTLEQNDALKRFADNHGRYWKSALIRLWSIGKDERIDDAALLRQVRNDLGPRWLLNFRGFKK